MGTMCEKCGVEIQIADFPFCPHGRTAIAIAPDDVPGGFVVENGFDQPTRFYSHSAHERALAARGLEIRAKYAGEHDKHLTNWAAGIDAQTLENAAVLLTRGRQQAREDRKAEAERIKAEWPVTVTEVNW